MSQASQRSSSDLARAIGARVTIRLREPSGGFRDIVGVLQSFGEGIGELANSKGEVLNFSESEIAIWREVKALPDRAGTGAPYSLRINELEALSDATWPADEINEIGKCANSGTHFFIKVPSSSCDKLFFIGLYILRRLMPVSPALICN